MLIPLLCGTGIFYTIKLRFVQVRLFPTALRFLLNNAAIFGKKADKSGMSSFQALATAVAAQVGTGNVAGAATAIVAGGPGALFWLWVAAFFGMATIFAEAVLAQTYRGVNAQGHVVGGPAFYMRVQHCLARPQRSLWNSPLGLRHWCCDCFRPGLFRWYGSLG